MSPEQKAELLLHPEVVGLNNSSLSLVFKSLLSSLKPSEKPSDNSTVFYMSSVPSASMQDPLRQARKAAEHSPKVTVTENLRKNFKFSSWLMLKICVLKHVSAGTEWIHDSV